jgi:hypothetical protein
VGSRGLVTLRHYFSLFDRIRIVLGSILVNPPMKVIFEKQNSSFANMKSYLDTHLRVVHVVCNEGYLEEVELWV